jgi:hypothetical protein
VISRNCGHNQAPLQGCTYAELVQAWHRITPEAQGLSAVGVEEGGQAAAAQAGGWTRRLRLAAVPNASEGLPRTAWKSPQQTRRSMVMPCLASSARSVA